MKLRILDCGSRMEAHRPVPSMVRMGSCPRLGLRVVLRDPGFGRSVRLSERVWPWAALLLVTFAPACNLHSARPGVPPAPHAALLRYEEAEKSFAAGEYAAAARSYEASLQAGISKNRDRALFRAGLAYALAGNAEDNAGQSGALFQRLATEYPASQYVPPSALILRLAAEIENLKDNLKDQQAKNKTLSEELRRLKDIDLRMKPTRPPK